MGEIACQPLATIRANADSVVHMPTTDPVFLPPLEWQESPNQSARNVRVPHLIVMHRWGNKPASTGADARSRYKGNIRFMCDHSKEVSAHIVYGGSLLNEACQLVAWDEKAWTEVAFNSVSYSIECCDAIWVPDPHRAGKVMDEPGLAQAARVAGFLCTKTGIPPVWSKDPLNTAGVVRHLDLGKAGNPNGHACPTTDPTLWRRFIRMVAAEVARGNYRKTWGRGRLNRLSPPV
jgi:hypothetical protein